ncbi:nondiscriminating aspartyl-tRNA synthetase [Deinobacterium chartae]|uniref:Aspartate--tRNA(Asp/Asn) ligase n=1 Tax=Deinobacterium chartae TaxID=521158 RepID=A0A841HYC6_9DEIO|nr:aspartate--tRNA(Asn) ligase [Deinobacterium chartae]MBB6098541.1 nondiscriminating aspartyl-tRNA synthetase [Deinobacterium chartae]
MIIPEQQLERSLTSQLAPLEGQDVLLRGWLYARRDLGGLQFLVLRDRAGIVQCVGQDLDLPLPESSIEVVGKVVAHPKAPGGFEVQVRELRVLSRAVEVSPLELPKVEWNVNPETLLDYRYVSVRGLKDRAALKVQAVLVEAFRDSLREQGFTEIFTPKLVSAGAEGGANLFEVDYFERKAYLAQSPQLYKQIMVGTFERVFETAPVYRAEEHATSRHLNEYLSLDVELGFIRSEEDVMAVEEGVLRVICRRLEARCREEFAMFGMELPQVPERIPRIPLAEARALIKQKYGYSVGGKDIDPEGERLLCQHFAEEHGSDWVFVTHYPKAARPFYAYYEPDGTTRSFDLLYRGLEVTTGGQRIHEYDMLVRSLEERGMSTVGFEGYLEVFKHGMPPHGGFAIGAERLTAKFLGIHNVRHARAFPRDRHRLTP